MAALPYGLISLTPGQTYYDVATALDSSGSQSAYSAPAAQSGVPSP